MRETKLSTRPDGNYHPAVQGVIIGLMQYVPSFSDMLTISRLLFPSPAFPGCHPLLFLSLSEMLAPSLSSNSISAASPVCLFLTPSSGTKMRWRSQMNCQQPGIRQMDFAQGSCAFFGQGEQGG